MSKALNIALLEGDGIGPEVTAEAVKVAYAVGSILGLDLVFKKGDIGGIAIEKHSDPYPDSTHELCLHSDAVLFGAIGDPKYDDDPSAKIRPEQGLLAMRKKLSLFANVRPLKVFESLIPISPLKPHIIQGVDMVCIRELTSGIYFGQPQGRSEDRNTAYDTCVYTREQIERILTVAFDFSISRRKKVTLVDKANILSTSRLWREVMQQMHTEYQDVEVEYLYVDNAAMQLLLRPKSFDVVVTENMFGDILTDEVSVLGGSLGLMPSASLGPSSAVYEPIHGSYPKAAGKGVANPCGTILSMGMMFLYSFGLEKASKILTSAVEESIASGIVTKDIAGEGRAYSTSEVGDWIASHILENADSSASK